jgi:hypothetical protein
MTSNTLLNKNAQKHFEAPLERDEGKVSEDMVEERLGKRFPGLNLLGDDGESNSSGGSR